MPPARLLVLVLAVTFAVGGSIAVPAPRAPAAPPHRDPVGQALRALEQRRSAEGVDTVQLEPVSAAVGPSNSTHVRFKQRIAGLEVADGGIVADVDSSDRVVATAGEAQRSGSPRRAVLAARRAADIAAAALHLPPVGRIASAGAAPERRTAFERGAYFQAPDARLVLFPLADGTLATAWSLELPASLGAWYDVMIDARTGAMLDAQSRGQGAGPGGEAFFDDPNDGPPVPVTYAGAMPAPRDTWSDEGLTSGNNVIVGLDRDADTEPTLSPIQPFGFSDGYRQSGGVDQTADADAAVNNVFYWMNFAHDRFYARGFNESAGNYQQTSFGAGGVEGDPVVAFVQWAAEHCDYAPFIICGNDAMFISQEDGLSSYAAFTLMSPPFPYVDGAFAADVVLHEYTHGVTQRLIGVATLGGPHGFALSEGWSDWFAASFTDDPVFAEYWNGNLVNGIRNYSMGDSPLTYADFCHIHPRGCEGHADGEIWAATLWDLRKAMIARYGPADGVRRAEELAIEGLMSTPGQPSFTEARDGILEADLARSGPDHCKLWSIFAARGLGASATGEGFPENTYSAAFDVPLRCAGDATSSDADGIPDAYERQQACLHPAADDAALDPDADGITSIREWVMGTAPCNPDTDGDHCGDLIETEPDHQFGGGRDPLNPWDFFDLTGDRAVTLDDALDVLSYFGAPPGNGPASLRDRYIADPSKPWRPAQSHDGVDLIDALAVLKSFGDFCAG